MSDMASVSQDNPAPPPLSAATWLRNLPILAGLLIMAVPTLYRLGVQVWSKEIGAHGPIVLATGAWLLWRRFPDMTAEAKPGNFILTLLGVAASLGIYVFGRAYDLISLEAAGLYGFGLCVLHDRFGIPVMLRNWFPIVYLGLLLPVPGWALDQFTAPLKLLVSWLSASIVEPFGIPIVREGVTMTVGPYQLLVEDACSGLNSLIGLIAITTFYIYLLRNAGWRYSLFLVCLIIPIAIFANVLRIIALILLTYFFGDAVGQGFLHVTAGLFLFAVSLLLMFAIDSVASRLLKVRNA
ncbi:exosortase V [Phenylobacterium sp.]|uniref:exosortase V n=1 Tax=Phenylobacterium sp. TaxID=1871053 RepID=UPI0025D75489|nr:exosortase V [Phenylobacterium sp.]MBX3483734.1 exosortase V [Phenylobacterium sp.]MCW5758149.1 exosortase V [Phenylobacterium sp.]